jgi:hypothetical protein
MNLESVQPVYPVLDRARKSGAFAQFALDELPLYSNSPSTLVGWNGQDRRVKTPDEVWREFQHDRWGEIERRSASMSNVTIEALEDFHSDSSVLQPFWMDAGFFIGTASQVLDLHVEWYYEVLSGHAAKASCLVELGAGFGSKILRLRQLPAFRDMPAFAGELTDAGCNLIKRCAGSIDVDLIVGHVDLGQDASTELAIPPGALIFTSYALHYQPELRRATWEFLDNLNPSNVVNFEPCEELYSELSLHGLLSRSYMQQNGYTPNIWSSLSEFCRGSGKSLNIRTNVLGDNPLLPISALEWSNFDD